MMSTNEQERSSVDSPPPTQERLEGQTYEIIRKRLLRHGDVLRTRLAELNQSRKEVFGSVETELVTTQRVTTDNNCQPRDMVAVGNRFLFGYNVHVGLRSQITLDDVFSVYRLESGQFHADKGGFLRDARFEQEFAELYKYYRKATFARFAIREPYLFMVFRVGNKPDDIKTFKWMIEQDGIHYVDNRSDYEFRYPPQHEFEWKRTTRDQHHAGLHPHVSIEDQVFVETVGGDLTVKVENNTETGEGIYSEPVENPDQTLDDAEIHYSIIDNVILLKVKPYQEQDYRYILFNKKIEQARRLDEIAHACVRLPDGHGLIFSEGYYLQTGQFKTFDTGYSDMMYEKEIRSPNGEDYLYVFFDREEGTYVLLSYNLISQEVATPLVCNGFAFLASGEMLTFRHQDQPLKHHAIQIWKTPYTMTELIPDAHTESPLYKIGNRDLVRAMAECQELLNLLEKEDSYSGLYLDVAKQAVDVLDSYFWIADADVGNLAEPLAEIRDAAQGALGEFEKVVRQREASRQELARVERGADEAIRAIQRESLHDIMAFVSVLADLRGKRGESIALNDLKYVDLERVEQLEQRLADATDSVSERCVDFLLGDEALAPYETQVETFAAQIPELHKVADARKVEEEIGETSSALEMLIEIVGNLKIDDATRRTAIIDDISTIFSRVNQVRAQIGTRKKELQSFEGAAEFSSQIKLLEQSVVNYLDICDSPDKCDEFLTRLMVQIEELEGKFAEFDEMSEQLGEKREEVYNAFEAKKVQLLEARNRRATSLMKSAERILKGIQNRVQNLESVSEIHGYFVGDLMVDKLRNTIEVLRELGDSVKADDLNSRLKTLREDGIRQLKDRVELFAGDGKSIRFGKHLFSVNTQALELTTVVKDETLSYHLTGTNYFVPLEVETLAGTEDLWTQHLLSESDAVYRSEYLAYTMLREAAGDQRGEGAGTRGIEVPTLHELALLAREPLTEHVREFMAPRYAEGYVKGIHDHDTALILQKLVALTQRAGLLRYSPSARSLGWLFWQLWEESPRKATLRARVGGFGRIRSLFPESDRQLQCIVELQEQIAQFAQDKPFAAELVEETGEFLFFALANNELFQCSGDAIDLNKRLCDHLSKSGFPHELEESLQGVRAHLLESFLLARDWTRAYVNSIATDEDDPAWRLIDEVASILVQEDIEESRIIHGTLTERIDGMLGTHPQIKGGECVLSLNEFLPRLGQFKDHAVPRFRRYTHEKHVALEEERSLLRLEEFEPRVLTSFVRNRLIDEVYLPLVGDNLAKQLGAAGETTRTDRMGLLLLISPPGYGKTTLMEYIANRLGLVFMKINGPTVGHEVTSLDPASAPNGGAREELEKLNLGLEMGDNVMLYLDDIQHVNPELLQKFISLCDATRKIEGTFRGQTRTYDLRGKKVCVVMAGNPYTESGHRFQIPDMLANRADTYNLGEIIGDSRAAFELSYLENAMTSNPTMARVASRHPEDIHPLIRLAESEGAASVELQGNYSAEEQNEMLSVLSKMLRVRDIVLKVNRQYIDSAAQADDYRTEPPFKLQGSYRNMNRIAERISPVMNDRELASLIISQYEQDAQTLTGDTEANLLKFHEILGDLTPQQSDRWNTIKATFARQVELRSFGGDDKFSHVIAQLSKFSEGLDGLKHAVASSAAQFADKPGSPVAATFSDDASQLLTRLIEQLQDASRQVVDPLPTQANIAPNPPGEQPPIRVQVVNRVPRLFLSVIREQFRLLQEWMEPISKVSQENQQGLQELQSQLSAAMENYDELLDQLEDSEE